MEISHEIFIKILKEKDKYEKMKLNLRNRNENETLEEKNGNTRLNSVIFFLVFLFIKCIFSII